MPLSTRYYETFYGVELSSATAYWSGSSYNQQLVKEYLSLDTSVVTSRSVNANDMSFLYPYQIDKEYAIEGVVTGHITIYNFASSTTYDWNTDRSASITLSARSAVLGYKEKILANVVLPPEYDLPPEEYTVVPFYIDMTNRVYITPSERLVVTVTNTPLPATSLELHYCFDNFADTEDFKIKIPFV